MNLSPVENGSSTHLYRLWSAGRPVLLAILALVLFRALILDWHHVPSSSMAPTLVPGDRILVNRLAYGPRLPFRSPLLHQDLSPQRGDIVTFRSPRNDLLLVKRVVGIPGDRVAMTANRLSLNGVLATYRPLGRDLLPDDLEKALGHTQVLDEALLGHNRKVLRFRNPRPGIRTSFPEVRVVEDHFLLLGDNRDDSEDYRVLGLVHRDRILARVERVLLSVQGDPPYPFRLERWMLPLP